MLQSTVSPGGMSAEKHRPPDPVGVLQSTRQGDAKVVLQSTLGIQGDFGAGEVLIISTPTSYSSERSEALAPPRPGPLLAFAREVVLRECRLHGQEEKVLSLVLCLKYFRK